MRIPYRRNPVTLGPAALGALRQILGTKYGRSPADVEGILALVQEASALLPEGDPGAVAGRVLGALEGILAVYDEGEGEDGDGDEDGDGGEEGMGEVVAFPGTAQRPTLKAPEGYPPTLPGENAGLLRDLVKLGATDFEQVTSPRLWALNESGRALDIIPYMLRQMPNDSGWVKWLARIKKRMEDLENARVSPEEREMLEKLETLITPDLLLAIFKAYPSASLGRVVPVVLERLGGTPPADSIDPFWDQVRATAERRVAEHLHNFQTQGKFRIQWSPGSEGVYVREREDARPQADRKQTEERERDLRKRFGGYTPAYYTQLFEELSAGLLDPTGIIRTIPRGVQPPEGLNFRGQVLWLLEHWSKTTHPDARIPAQWQVPRWTFPMDAHPQERVVQIQRTREGEYFVTLGSAGSDGVQAFEFDVYKTGQYKTLGRALKFANDYLAENETRRKRTGNVAQVTAADVQPYIAPTGNTLNSLQLEAWRAERDAEWNNRHKNAPK